jgi:hypothetical protein
MMFPRYVPDDVPGTGRARDCGTIGYYRSPGSIKSSCFYRVFKKCSLIAFVAWTIACILVLDAGLCPGLLLEPGSGAMMHEVQAKKFKKG